MLFNPPKNEDDLKNWEITTKNGNKTLAEITEEDGFIPSAGLGAFNQLILNAIHRNTKRKKAKENQ